MNETGSAGSVAVKPDDLRAVAASLGGTRLVPVALPAVARSSADRAADPFAGDGVGPAPHTHVRNQAPTRIALGEELPIFCERCGYALHGLPPQRCDRCSILHFPCPECGHRQPINTLRPAAQRVLGRVRAFVLGLWVFFKLNFFGWLLFAWWGMGIEWAYEFRPFPDPTQPNNWTYNIVPREVDVEASVAFALFALAFGMVGRMLLLRWRRGWAVGAVLGCLVLGASSFGAWFQANVEWRGTAPSVPVGADFRLLLVSAALTVVFAAVVVWPIWMALAHLFLPERTARALLDWQRSVGTAAPTRARQE